MNQADKAKKFAELHVKGNPVLLYNSWNVASATAIVGAGAEAIATSGWAIAASLGYGGAESIPRTVLEEVTAGIVESVEVPVTADFGGYEEDDESLAKNVSRLLHLGAIGINFNDRRVRGSSLYSIDRQVKRIAAIRRAGDQAGISLFLNATTRLFLDRKEDDPTKLVEEAVRRAEAYAEHGASGFFIPGLRNENLIGEICRRVAIPVNVMRMEGVPSNDRLAELGVARISYGNEPHTRAMRALQMEAELILEKPSVRSGSADCAPAP